MKITQEDIRHVAKLARLDLDEAAIEAFYGQLGDILNYMETLNQVNTQEVPPTAHAIDLTNALRDDTPKPHLDPSEALDNAPSQDDGCFIVPKVIG
jgi:aspartyl-tRNA(Asn)/glutamyl-tRNA(Gln) amidotransferase subunit C